MIEKAWQENNEANNTTMSTKEETKIDWSKPVQTKETPPRKVEIVTTNGRGEYPVIGYCEKDTQLSQWRLDGVWSSSVTTRFDLENTPTWKLPDPPEGQQWHRVDGWTEEMLPCGYRPLLLGEAWIKGDEIKRRYSHSNWDVAGSHPSDALGQDIQTLTAHCRTARPIPQQPEQWAAEKAAFAAGETIQHKPMAHPDVAWKNTSVPIWAADSIYRIKPKPQKVKLEPCDVPPGSVIRGAGEAKGNSSGWCMIVSSSETGIRIWRHCEGSAVEIKWESLMQAESQIWRPTDTDWQPCYKEVEQP